MDAGYAVLLLLLGFIALMVLWGVGGISPIALIRLALGGGDVMSRLGDRVADRAAASATKPGETGRNRNGETDEKGDRKNEKQIETFSFAETEAMVADALARLIISGDLDKTPAIKLGLGGKSGESYQQKKAILDAALERQRPPSPEKYRELDEQRRPVLN